MPHAAFRGIALVGNPAVCLEVVQKVVFSYQLRITHDFKYHQIAAVRQDNACFSPSEA